MLFTLIGSATATALGIYHLHAWDLGSIWSGPRALLLGRDPYDPATWESTVRQLGVPHVSPIYVYLPWTLVTLLPLGLLPYDLARVVWTIGGGALAVAAIGLLLSNGHPAPAQPGPGVPAGVVGSAESHPRWLPAAAGLTLTLSGAALTNVFTAQWGFVLTAGLAVAAAGLLRDARWGAFGMIALLMKPQLFVLAFPGMLLYAMLRGSRRFAVASAVAAGTLVTVSAAIFAAGLDTWLRLLPPFVATADLIDATLNGLLGEPTAASSSMFAAIGILAGVGISLVVLRLSADGLPVVLSASIAFAPHARSYDQLPLLVPLVLAARPGALSAVTFAVFGIGSLAMYVIGTVRSEENWSVLVPLACVALLTVAAIGRRRRTSPVPEAYRPRLDPR